MLRKVKHQRTLHILGNALKNPALSFLPVRGDNSLGLLHLHSLFPRDSPSMLQDAQKMRFCYQPMLPLLPDAPLLAVLLLIPLHPLFLGTSPFCLLLNAPEDAASALFHQRCLFPVDISSRRMPPCILLVHKHTQRG